MEKRLELRNPRTALVVYLAVTCLFSWTMLALAKALASDPKAPPEWRRIYAWALGKDGRLLEAGEAWRALSSDSRDRALAAEACFFAGFLPYEAGLYALSRERFQSCNDALRGTPWDEQARWYEALSWLLDAKGGEALPLLQQLVDDVPSSKEAEKYRYWLAHAQRSVGLEEHAAETFARVAAQEPTSWYGLLARKRLSSKPVLGAVVARDAFAQSAATDAEAEDVRLLYAFGFAEAARERAARQGTTQRGLALSQVVDDAHRSWRHGARYRPSPAVRQGKLNASTGWRASYPEPFPDLVVSSSVRHGIEPALTWAIMRTESGFAPEARSPVGALGLMQLMPYTASGIATVLGVDSPSVTELQKPETNIELGTGALGLWMRELGHPVLVVASYNGGPNNVVRWLRSFGHLPPDLFVERIPFLETRDYVKKVLPTLALYRALRGEALDVSLPETSFDAPRGEVTVFTPTTP
ncbi:MAG: transglycosylase SLT domain-containing protein [Myxococcota bacterium]